MIISWAHIYFTNKWWSYVSRDRVIVISCYRYKYKEAIFYICLLSIMWYPYNYHKIEQYNYHIWHFRLSTMMVPCGTCDNILSSGSLWQLRWSLEDHTYLLTWWVHLQYRILYLPLHHIDIEASVLLHLVSPWNVQKIIQLYMIYLFFCFSTGLTARYYVYQDTEI